MDHKMACTAFRGVTAENGRIVALVLSDSYMVGDGGLGPLTSWL